MNRNFWLGKRVFLTGHTGFKGSWLSLFLQSMGAEVYGFSLKPSTTPALFDEARVANLIVSSEIGDIRDFQAVSSAMVRCDPDIIIHMAAQPLVRYSYTNPVETYSTNVMGTVHVLEAARKCDSIRAIVNVTTDKCYENKEWIWGYREDEPMGGYDPYSSSKGCSELVSKAYRCSFLKDSLIGLATARAGNVIGGGDWAADRLVPDILRAFEKGENVLIRNPNSIRPWQHVLEPLSGYLMLAERLYAEGQLWAEPWNFGPNGSDICTVRSLVDNIASFFPGVDSNVFNEEHYYHEANNLKLDSSKANNKLGWYSKWQLVKSLEKVVAWHKAWLVGKDMQTFSLEQINEYQI